MRLPFALRKLLAGVLRWIPAPIVSGPNRGCRWSIAASGRHLLGRFEKDRVEAIRWIVSEGDCVWDAGAHHGYVTLATSRWVGPRGHVYAFEPSPYNLAFLRRHVMWNGRSNVEVVPVALGGESRTACFGGCGSSQGFRVGSGSEVVEVAPIPALLSRGLRAPDFLKLDVEGQEGDVLEACAAHLPPTTALLVSIHSLPEYHRVTDALTAHGFEILESPIVRRLRGEGHWGKNDPDVLAVGPERRHLLEGARQLAYFQEPHRRS